MLAFNELLDNMEQFCESARLIGIKCDLDAFVALEDARKTTQLEFESTRAACNKLCAKMPELRRLGADTRELLEQILEADKKCGVLKRRLDKQSNYIDKKLRGVRNLPLEVLLEDRQIFCKKTEDATCSHVADLIFKGVHSQEFRGSLKAFLKSLKNVLFAESELPQLVRLSDGFVFFCTNYAAEENLNRVLERLSQLADSLTELCSARASFCASRSFLAQFDGFALLIDYVGEFSARDYQIKYKNLSLDMTKFVAEIDFKFVKKR